MSEWGGRGLGSWIVDCVKEWWDMMPSGRRLMLITSEGKKEDYYAKVLKTGRMEDQGSGYRIYSAKGRGVQPGC